MCYRVSIKKRILFLLLAGWITFSSVFFAYQETTYCAEWVAGVVASIGGAPLLTALCIGGVVVAGGIAIYEFSQTTPEDHRNFLNGIKDGFTEFCTDSARKDIAMEGVITDTAQAEQEAIRRATDDVKNFWDNAVETVTTTGKKLKASVVERWKLFCKIIGRVADNGLEGVVDGPITDTTVINPPFNNSLFNDYGDLSTNIGLNTIEYNGNYYLVKGQVGNRDGVLGDGNYINIQNVPSDRIRIFCLGIAIGDLAYILEDYIDINKLSGEIITQNITRTTLYSYTDENISNIVRDTNMPCIIYDANIDDTVNGPLESFVSDYVNTLSVGSGSSSGTIKDYERTINQTLNNTKEGEAIKTGRRTIVNNGDVIEGVFEEDSIPVKKSGVREAEGVISAPVGWDIPADDVWDGVIDGDIPWQAVPEGTGTVSIPSDDVSDTTDDDTRVVTDPTTIVIDNTTSADPDNPMPDRRPWQEIIQDMAGSFFPAQLDWTSIFPFCIPFDIIYLIGKFNGANSVPPVITIPIVYPQALQPVLGESYEVVIDFNNFVVVRNVIRVFLLLLFIIGLMKVTRDLIRG